MKKRLTNNLALKLAALVFAFLLWLIVVNEIDPVERRTYSNVVVTMLHDELILNKGNTYRIVNGNTATVTVTAKRSILEKITPEAIRKEVLDFVEMRLDDMKCLMEKNLDVIAAEAMKGRC